MTGLGQGEEDDDREEDISFVPRTTTYSKLETISAAEIGVLVRLLYLTVAFATIYTVWALTMLRTTWVDDSYLRQSMLTGLSNRTLMDMARRTESLVVDVPPPRDSDQLLDPYRCITAMVLSGNPGGDSPVPDPCVALASASLPPSVALFGQTVQLVFAVLMTLVAIVYAVRIIRHRGHALVTHEQVWVLMLLVFGSLYINVPYTSWNIYDKINNSSGSGSYEISRVEQLWIIAEPFFRTVRDGAFTVSTLFFVWASMCSLRILDPRARLGWRFYIPKVVTLLVYYVAKWLADDKLGIRSSLAPLVSGCYALLLFTRYDLWTGRGVAIAFVAALTAMEVGIIGWIVWEGVVTRRVLKKADYMRSRTKQVTFRYYAFANSVFYIFYVFLATLLISATPTGLYLIPMTFTWSPEVLQLDIIVDLRFGFYVVFFAYVTILAYVNLPADSRGFLGWFRGERTYVAVPNDAEESSETFTDHSGSTRTLPSMGPLRFRLDFQPSEASDSSSQQPQSWWRWAREDKKGDLTAQQTAEPLTYRKREARRHQYVLKANCFVFQTHAALLNFAWLASYVGTPKMDHADQLQARGRFAVGPSFYDPITDTRAIVVDADDRIIVAFKGTTSTRNLRSNLKVLNSKLSSVLEASAAAGAFTLPSKVAPPPTAADGAAVNRAAGAATSASMTEGGSQGAAAGGPFGGIATDDMPMGRRRSHSLDSNDPSSRPIPVRSGLTGDDEAWLGVDVEAGAADMPAGVRRESPRLLRLLGPKYSAARVHRGFADAYLSVAQPLVARVRALLKKKARPVYLTGHSLGGALATICSMDLWAQLPLSRHEISVTTFGSPKVGNFAFQRTYDAVLPMHWRIMLSADLIVTLPKVFYRHVGKKVVLHEGQIFLDPNTLDTALTSGPSASFVYHRKAAYLLAFRAWSDRHHGSERCGLWDWPFTRDDVRRFGPAFRVGTTEARGRPLSREFGIKPSRAEAEGLPSPPLPPAVAAAAACQDRDIFDDDDDGKAGSDGGGWADPARDPLPAVPGPATASSRRRAPSQHGMPAVGKVMTPLRRSYAARLLALDSMVDSMAGGAGGARPGNAAVVARWARLVRQAIQAKPLRAGEGWECVAGGVGKAGVS